MRVPADFPVRPLRAGSKASAYAGCLVTCGTCGRSWDDSIATGSTPAPSGRCPFEYYHAKPRRPRASAARRALFTAAQADALQSAVEQFAEDCDSRNTQRLFGPLNRAMRKVHANAAVRKPEGAAQ